MSGSKGREIVEKLLTFIEMVSNRKLKFSSIVDMNTGKTSDPTDRMVAAVDAALRAAKVEGLREAAGRIRKRGDEYMKDCEAKDASGKKYRDTYEMRRVNSGRAWAFKDLADELDARAAQIERGE